MRDSVTRGSFTLITVQENQYYQQKAFRLRAMLQEFIPSDTLGLLLNKFIALSDSHRVY
jgi:hypothetical protein